MTARVQQYDATVVRREVLTPHLVRLVLSVAGGFASTGVPDEWVGLVVPGQFQSRYYTARSSVGAELVLDVVIHDVGLVTDWVRQDVVGQALTLHEPKGSFAMPEGAQWLMLVGDLTGLPAMARIAEAATRPVRIWAEVPEVLLGYLPSSADVTWLQSPVDGSSRLAEVVRELEWPPTPGYFWMAGESAQMRAIRKHLMRERRLPSTAYDVMGYWRASAGRRPRAVDPGPIWREGKAQGLSDEEIWAAYDHAQSRAQP